MKRIVMVVAGLALLTALAGAQSLGEFAREQRQLKHPSAKKVYTNDDIPSVREAETAPPATAEAKPAAKEDKAKAAEPDDKSGKVYEVRIAELKKEVAQLEREINVNQRENRLRVAQYYSDAGNALRDSKAWAEEQRKAQAELDAKQKDLAAAKEKLAAAEEEARKAGVRIAQ
jgi:hypothetical protein